MTNNSFTATAVRQIKPGLFPYTRKTGSWRNATVSMKTASTQSSAPLESPLPSGCRKTESDKKHPDPWDRGAFCPQGGPAMPADHALRAFGYSLLPYLARYLYSEVDCGLPVCFVRTLPSRRSEKAFPLGESPQCSHWGIEGTALKVMKSFKFTGIYHNIFCINSKK